MDTANNNSDIGRTWSSVLGDLEALERRDDFSAALGIVLVSVLVVLVLLGGVAGVATMVTSQSELQTIQYEGHTFILYDGASYAGGIVHHPNCTCHDH